MWIHHMAVQAEFISILTFDLSNHSGHINRAEVVGHDENL